MSSKTTFRCLKVYEENKTFSARIIEQKISDLPKHDTLIRVSYSSINYKDALSAKGNRGVTKEYPHTPGIDAVGTVERSDSPELKEGDQVIVTGYDLGMNTHGGYSEYICVPSEWIVHLPKNLTQEETMIIGTAGFTAAFCLYKLERNGQKKGKILVTGATGGVGSLAVMLLAKAGYEVIASTGKAEAGEYLRSIGAADCIDRKELEEPVNRPVLRSRWAGAVDTVGGHTLVNAIKATAVNGNVTSCGLVSSWDMQQLTVIPFIINGVNLLGINSATCEREDRDYIWEKLSKDWKLDNLNSVASFCNLEDLPTEFDKIIAGGMKGRMVVKI